MFCRKILLKKTIKIKKMWIGWRSSYLAVISWPIDTGRIYEAKRIERNCCVMQFERIYPNLLQLTLSVCVAVLVVSTCSMMGVIAPSPLDRSISVSSFSISVCWCLIVRSLSSIWLCLGVFGNAKETMHNEKHWFWKSCFHKNTKMNWCHIV